MDAVVILVFVLLVQMPAMFAAVRSLHAPVHAAGIRAAPSTIPRQGPAPIGGGFMALILWALIAVVIQ